MNTAMSIQEILVQQPKLTAKECKELRNWLDAEEFPETDELTAAADGVELANRVQAAADSVLVASR